MKQFPVVILLTLILLPIIWNGVSLFHFVIEHTHTFCQTESEHAHSTSENCLSIFQLAEKHNQNQLPSPLKNEFKELKQYLSPLLLTSSLVLTNIQQRDFEDIPLPVRLIPKDIFQPPIFS